MTIAIRARRDIFYRCGVAHRRDWTEYPDDHFTAGELARLRAEPMLEVRIVEDEAPPPDGDLAEACRAAVRAGSVTADGRPTVEAVEKLFGSPVSAAERDQAWKDLQAGEGE